MIRRLQELGQAGITDAELRGRLITPTNIDDRPELIWCTFRQQLPELLHLIEIERDRQLDDLVEIEVGLIPPQVAAALKTSAQTAQAAPVPEMN
jgi:hypothetical protein